MNNEAIKIVLFASSSIVIPTINRLLQIGKLAGVVLTERMDADAVQLKQQLDQWNIPNSYFKPDHPKETIHQIQLWQANIGLVFTFSHKLPLDLIHSCSKGFYNLHASDLPKYRGAMPLYWQIRNQEKQSYLSIIKVEETFDTGDILLQQSIPIHSLDTLNTLAHKMAEQSAPFIQKFIDEFQVNTLIAVPQKTGTCATIAPMPTQQDLVIDWKTMKSEDITALARAGNPVFNGALFQWQQSFIGLLQASQVEYPKYGVPEGTVLYIGEPEGLIVATINGAIRLDIVIITEGVFSGLAFAERFGVDAGQQLT